MDPRSCELLPFLLDSDPPPSFKIAVSVQDRFEVVARPTSFFFHLIVAGIFVGPVAGFYPAKSLDLNLKQMNADSKRGKQINLPSLCGYRLVTTDSPTPRPYLSFSRYHTLRYHTVQQVLMPIL
jgi:hypothetical protein